MIFDNKRKKSVVKFFDYVENVLIPSEIESEAIELLKNQIQEGRELISHNEWGIAFENLASELIEQYMIVNREGESLAKEVIKRCNLEQDWILKLRRLNSDGYIKGSWQLADCIKIAEENKYTFYKPSRKLTDQLKIGNSAKLNFQFESTNHEDPSGERMWVIITDKQGDTFKGTLDNNPFYLRDLHYQDIIEFEHKHIIDHNLEISEPNLIDKYLDRCFVTNKILYQNVPVSYLYREEPMEKEDDSEYVDSGWRILAGDETDEYMDDPQNSNFVSLGAVLSLDDSFIDLLEAEIGSSFERNESGKFIEIQD